MRIRPPAGVGPFSQRMLLFFVLLVLVGVLAPGVSADSRQRNPLRSLSQIEDAVLHSPSHRVHALSHFQLSFTLHQLESNRRLPVRLRLQPNHNILAEDAAIHVQNGDGSVTVERIKRHEHRVFQGDAFVQNQRDNHHWTNAGWASVYVHMDGERPVFEGAFHLNGDHHHILTSHSFLATRLEADPLIAPAASEAEEYMVVWRDSDILPDEELQSATTLQELRRRASNDGLDSLDNFDFGVKSQPACSADGLLFNINDEHPIYKGIDLVGGSGSGSGSGIKKPSVASTDSRWLFGRQMDGGTGSTGGNSGGVNLRSTIGNSQGCPTARKVALVGIATDCNYAAAFPSRANISANVIAQISSASRVYENTFNISLGIQNLVIQGESCPTTPETSTTPWNAACSSTLTITDRLNLFSQWRGQQHGNDTNAFWMMLTTCPTGSAVGLAWLGQLCVQGSQSDGSSNETIAAANVVVRTSSEWQVMAHETGHTFGAVHDCTASTCNDGTVTRQQCCPLSATECDANGRFIMNPSSGSSMTQFSACTLGNICSAIGRNSVRSTCLSNNRDVPTITGSECGNGIVEANEDCDCGGEENCGDNPCCDPRTCRFRDNALCDPANDECCTASCQLAGAETVCRPSTGLCDPAETCSGTAAACPADANAPDGTSCGDSGSGLTCAAGQCTSRDLQCKTLMGSLTSNNDTYACDSNSCTLSCASPEFGPNTCATLQQNFLDGTPCGSGGHCTNGRCDGSSFGREVGDAIRNHMDIVIPVSVVVGVLVAIAILSCIWSAIRRRRNRNRQMSRLKDTLPPGMPPGAVAMTNAGVWRDGRANQNRSRNTLTRNPSQMRRSGRFSWFGKSSSSDDNYNANVGPGQNGQNGPNQNQNQNQNINNGNMPLPPPSVGPWRSAGYGGGDGAPPPRGMSPGPGPMGPTPPPHGGYYGTPPPYSQQLPPQQQQQQWVSPFGRSSVRYM